MKIRAVNLADPAGSAGSRRHERRFGAAPGHGEGQSCQSPAMPNGRCRIHGGRSPGARPAERNGNWRGGFYSQRSQAERRRLCDLIRQMRETVDELP